jgi:hypothetical protein
MATLRNAIADARTALINYTPLTDLISADKITFGNSPQKDVMPRIVIEVSGVEYQPTFKEARKSQVFQMDFGVYAKSVDQCTAIMDEVRYALEAYTSADFAIRLVDETFQADVDNNMFGVIFAEFTDSVGDTNTNVAGTGQTLTELIDFYVQETTGVVPAFNATGQPGEGATALWSVRRIADGYTGPLLQVGKPDTVTNTYTDVTDISEADYVDYYVENGYSSQDDSSGDMWHVLRVYDQIGSNDLVYDWQESGTVTTVGPRIGFDCGSYHINFSQTGKGFVSVSQVRYDNFTCIAETAQTSLRKVVFGGAMHPDGQPYDYFALQTWNSNSNHGMYRMMAGNGFNYTDVSTINEILQPAYPGSVDIRRGMGMSRQDAVVTCHTGVNSFKHESVSNVPTAGATCNVGWSADDYNDASSGNDMFMGAVYFSGVFKDNEDLTACTEAFTDEVGYRQHRQVLTSY